MKLAVLLTLAAVAMGRPPPCEDYCRTMWFTTQLPPPWDPSCDCAKRQIPIETYNGKPVYTATTIFKIDDTGVYFDPAKMHQAEGVTYINQPFYVVNSIEEFLTRPPMTAHNKAPGNIQVRQFSPDMKRVKFKSRNIASFDDSNSYKSHSYTYRTEELPKIKTNYRTFEQGSKVIHDTQDMRQTISKCVDLYLMAESRIYNNGSELAKIWGKSKYHKFSKLSDEDLMVTMRQECNETEYFVKKSVEEILDKKTKKKVVYNNENYSKPKQNKSFVEPIYAAKFEKRDFGPISDGNVDNFKTSGLMGPGKNNPFPVPPIDPSDASPLSSGVSKASMLAQDATRIDTKMASPIGEPYKVSSLNYNNREMQSDLDNKGNEDISLFINQTDLNDVHKAKLLQRIPIHYVKALVEGDNANEKYINRSIEKYPNSTLASQYTAGIEIATVTYSEDRQKYNENEVPPTRVITREFAEVVESVINGTEDLQREDPVDEKDENTDNPLAALARGGPGDTIQLEKDDQQMSSLIGNLYLRFGENYIPAKFVQKSDGKLHVAIDGPAICMKINLEHDNESSMLSDFCDKIPNN